MMEDDRPRVMNLTHFHNDGTKERTKITIQGETMTSESTYYTDLDIYVFIGKGGKIMGYGLHPTMYDRYLIKDKPAQPVVPDETIGMIRVNGVKTELAVRYETGHPEEKELVNYKVSYPSIGVLVRKAVTTAPPEHCPIVAVEGAEELKCADCKHAKDCDDGIESTRAAIERYRQDAASIDQELAQYYGEAMM